MNRNGHVYLPEGFAPGPWDVSPAEYLQAGDYVSNSSLEVFRRSVPLYHMCQITGAPFPVRHGTDNRALTVGKALHCAVLMPPHAAAMIPPDFEAGFHVERDPLALVNEGIDPTEAKGAFPPGSIALTEDEFDRVMGMREALLCHQTAGTLLRGHGVAEYAVRWQHPGTGLPMKAMFDRLISSGPLIDIKTTEDPSPRAFARSVLQYGYHRKAALYVQGRREALGRYGQFLFVAVGSRRPYEVGIYTLSDSDLAAAAEENEALLAELKDCMDFDQWGSRLSQWPTVLDLSAA